MALVRVAVLTGALLLTCTGGCGGDAQTAGPKDASADSSGPDSGTDLVASTDVSGAPDGVDAAADATAQDSGPQCPGNPGCPCVGDEDCDAQAPCVNPGTCVDEVCKVGTPLACDDGNLCTQDFCEPAVGCTATVVEHWCSDGNPCTIGDTCTGSTCTSGKPASCDDGNACTTDSCIAGQGCQYVDNKLECKPADACAEASYCFMGGCEQGKPKPCDDGNICTWNACDPKKGCQYVGIPGPAACLDGVLAGGRCWKAVKVDSTWAESRDACHAWGGELASIRNKYDNQTARKAADDTCGKVPAWIGLSDIAIEGQFRWVDGEKAKYHNWNNGEPNNSGDEDVTELLPDGAWNDIGVGAKHGCAVCGRALSYVCDDGEPCTVPTQCAGGTCLPATVTTSCDDGNGCTLDGCAVGLGCGHTAVDDGTACGTSGTCKGGYCNMALPSDATSSCAGLAAGAPSGLYWLDVDGPGSATPTQVWCDMATEGGKWALVLKVDGNAADSGYDSKLWTDSAATVGASPLPDTKTARLAGYATLPVTAVRLDLLVDKQWRTLVIAVKAANLRALLTGPKVATTVGLLGWESLLPSGSIQTNCHAEGFQVASDGGGAKLRVGIFGNNENDCGSVDSWLGLGATGGQCGVAVPPGVGNVACWGPDHGDAKTAAIAHIYVR